MSLVVDLIRSLGCMEVLRKKVKSKSRWVWKPPASGLVKVNVDGSFLGTTGSGGIRGVFRDSEGRVLLMFGKAMWADSAIHAKILAL